MHAEMAKRSYRRGSRGPEDLSQWRLDNGGKQPGLLGQEMEIPRDGSWYSRTHRTGHGAQHCGQRFLPCAASGIEQRLVGPGLAFRTWISLPWQGPPQNATSVRQKDVHTGHPFSTRRRFMTLIPMKLAEGPWPSLPASMEASSAQCAGAGAGVVAISICSHTHAGRSEPRACLASFMRASHPNSTLMVTTNIPEASCLCVGIERQSKGAGWAPCPACRTWSPVTGLGRQHWLLHGS